MFCFATANVYLKKCNDINVIPTVTYGQFAKIFCQKNTTFNAGSGMMIH